jgi:hypothetical protein
MSGVCYAFQRGQFFFFFMQPDLKFIMTRIQENAQEVRIADFLMKERLRKIKNHLEGELVASAMLFRKVIVIVIFCSTKFPFTLLSVLSLQKLFCCR